METVTNCISVNITNKAGETALHNAVKSGNNDIVNMLVQCWADLSIVSEEGSLSDVAKSFNQQKIGQTLDEIQRREMENTKLFSQPLWLQVSKTFNPSHDYKSIYFHSYRRTLCAKLALCANNLGE
jgi:hypothetical protein